MLLYRDYFLLYYSELLKAVTCGVCKKTTKIACLTGNGKLQQKLHQKRQADLKVESEDVKVSTKKDRKKERRKLQRKKKAIETDEDKDAGLILPETVGSESKAPLNNERSGPNIKESVLEDSRKAVETETSAKRGENVREKMVPNETSHRNIQNVETQKKHTITAGKSRNVSLPEKTTASEKSFSKKKKSKQMSQQLSSILKQEKKKQNEGTLTDFLSSL